VDLPKTFDSKSAEERWFQKWIELGYFKADPAREGKVFSVVIPPPNITGQLHLGHALNVSLQDIIVRHRSRWNRDAKRGREGSCEGCQKPSSARPRRIRRSRLAMARDLRRSNP
jgi:isoleucyl-tRNA synthetase